MLGPKMTVIQPAQTRSSGCIPVPFNHVHFSLVGSNESKDNTVEGGDVGWGDEAGQAAVQLEEVGEDQENCNDLAANLLGKVTARHFCLF